MSSDGKEQAAQSPRPPFSRPEIQVQDEHRLEQDQRIRAKRIASVEPNPTGSALSSFLRSRYDSTASAVSTEESLPHRHGPNRNYESMHRLSLPPTSEAPPVLRTDPCEKQLPAPVLRAARAAFDVYPVHIPIEPPLDSHKLIIKRRQAAKTRAAASAYMKALQSQLPYDFDMRGAVKAAGSNYKYANYKSARMRNRARSNLVAATICKVRRNIEVRVLEALALQEHLRNSMEGQLPSETDASLTSCSSAPTDGHGKPLTGNDVLNVNQSDLDEVFERAVCLHAGAPGVPRNLEKARKLYESIAGVHPSAVNNLAVLIETEKCTGDERDRNLRRALTLYECAVSTSDCDIPRGNLALLLWLGPGPVERDIPRAIQLLSDAVGMLKTPLYRVLLSRILSSDESGAYRDPCRAVSLLEEAIIQDMYVPAILDLHEVMRRGTDDFKPNRVRAESLFRLFQHQAHTGANGMLSVVSIEKPQLVLSMASRKNVEKRLSSAKAKQSQVFVLAVGGAGRGKTSVIRSLRGLSYVKEHNPTEFAAVARFTLLPGDKRLTLDELNRLAFNKDSLIANLSRNSSLKDDPAPQMNTWQEQEYECDSEKTYHQPEGNANSALLGSEKGSISVPATSYEATFWREFPNVLERVNSGFRDESVPLGPNGALVQCWDLAGQSQYVMAHALFIKNGNVFLFLFDLKRLWDLNTRLEEVRELCRWMQLVYALVEDVAAIQPILVGTRKHSFGGDVQEAERVLRSGLLEEIGEAVYDTWVRVENDAGTNKSFGIPFIAVENSTALEDPMGSGTRQLEVCLKAVVDRVADERRDIPARWVAFIEELERSIAAVLSKSDVFSWTDGFPAFSCEKEERDVDALNALRYFSKLGRIVLFEMSEEEFYVFPRPEIILTFIRQVTGPEELARRRLTLKQANMLDKGLVTHEGLRSLWQGCPNETRTLMLELLCRFDILMRLQSQDNLDGSFSEVIAIPALLPKSVKGLNVSCKTGETELRVSTKFTDSFPPGLSGSLVSYLHKHIGGGKTKTGFIGSEAAVLTSRVDMKHSGRVLVSLVSDQRRIDWKIFAKRPLRLMHACLKALEDFLEGPLRGLKAPRKHAMKIGCSFNLNGCGADWTVEFELPSHWIHAGCQEALPNLEGECLSSCEEVWKLQELYPEISTKEYSSSSPTLDCESTWKHCDVFISHAGVQNGKGGDKFHFARPLYNDLRRRGMSCFLDKVSLRPGDDGADKMISAMKTADIGVFILSPEFACRGWTMKELECFLVRKRIASKTKKPGDRIPILIPVFYRLSLQECRRFDPEKYSKLFHDEGFYDEVRQREISTAKVKALLNELSCTTGVENDDGASNDIRDPFASFARKFLVERVTMAVSEKYGNIQANRAKNSST